MEVEGTEVLIGLAGATVFATGIVVVLVVVGTSFRRVVVTSFGVLALLSDLFRVDASLVLRTGGPLGG